MFVDKKLPALHNAVTARSVPSWASPPN